MTREDIIRLAREAGWDDHHCQFDTRIERFHALATAAEREACAELVVDLDGGLEWVAVAIRARNNQ